MTAGECMRLYTHDIPSPRVQLMTDTPRKAGGQQDTHADIALLIKIRDRAVCLANSLGYGHYARDSGGLFLDLLNVHQAVGLQLADLLAADDGQF